MNRLRIWIVIAMISGLSVTLCSCPTLIGFTAVNLQSTEKVDARYEPPGGKTALVLVNDSRVLTSQPLAGALTHYLNMELVDNEVARKVVRYDHLLDLRAATPRSNLLKPGEIGSRLDAEWVCHVLVDEFTLGEESARGIWEGRLAVRVRVVRKDGEILWPTDTLDGYRVKPVETPLVVEHRSAYGDELTRSMCRVMADRIAKLFYDHRVAYGENTD